MRSSKKRVPANPGRYPTILDQIRALPLNIPAAGKRQPYDTLPASLEAGLSSKAKFAFL
jgi:hypothetical protein